MQNILKRIFFYWTVVKYGFKSKFTYRVSTFWDMVGSIIYFLVQIMIWKALLGQDARSDTNFTQMVTYLIITRFVSMLVSSTAGNEITNRIEDGSISLDFVRPLNLKVYLFCNDMGTNAFKTFVVFVPFCMLLTLGYGFELPKSPMQFIAFLATVICGTFIMFYYSYILGLLSFWLIRNPFISWHFRNVETLFSGQFVPIWFYPSWLAALTQYLPFRYFTYEPISIYLGRTPFSETGRVLLIQAFWMLFMYLIERWIWSKAFRRVMVQGG